MVAPLPPLSPACYTLSSSTDPLVRFFSFSASMFEATMHTHVLAHTHTQLYGLVPGLHSFQFWLLAVPKTGGGDGLGSQLVRHTNIHI